MPYIERKPSPTLAPYVDSFWLSQNGSIPNVNRILPDGCVDILFPFKGRILSTCAGHTQALKTGETYVMGTMTTFADVALSAGAVIAGIRFKPLGFSTFFGLPLDGLENGVAEFSELRVPVLFDQPEDFLGATRLLEEQLYQRIKLTDPRIRQAVDLIRLSGGNVKIDTLVDASCLSMRQFEKNFRQQLGVKRQSSVRRNFG